jgi:hypothetical protein
VRVKTRPGKRRERYGSLSGLTSATNRDALRQLSRDRSTLYHPCFAERFGGVSAGKETQGWRDSSHTAMVGAGKFGSAKLPMAIVTCPGKPSFSQYRVEPHVGQK